MAEPLHHPTDAMQDALDGRLDGDRLVAFEAHLASCARCRREYRALGWTKATLARTAADVDAPAGLDARIRAALDREDEASGDPAPADAPRPRRRAFVVWAGAAAVAAIVVWIANWYGRPSLPAQAAADFRAFAAGRLSLDIAAGDPAALETSLQQAGLPFAARVFDFAMMDYRLAGGRLHRVDGQPSALFAYRGPDDLALLCQMYQGHVSALPSPDERRTNDGIEFLVYRDGDLTVVFWQEGEIVCMLVANGDREASIRLAFAKAVKV
jgi:anti-sigma factor RsiW